MTESDTDSGRQHARSGSLSLTERLANMDQKLASLVSKLDDYAVLRVRLTMLEKIVYGIATMFAVQATTIVIGVVIWAVRQGAGT